MTASTPSHRKVLTHQPSVVTVVLIACSLATRLFMWSALGPPTAEKVSFSISRSLKHAIGSLGPD